MSMGSKVHSDAVKEHQRSLYPCNSCQLKDLCRYAFVGYVEVPAEVFSIKITCSKKQPIEAPLRGDNNGEKTDTAVFGTD